MLFKLIRKGDSVPKLVVYVYNAVKAKHWYINAVNDSILSGEDTYCYQPRSSAPCCWLCGGGLSIVSILLRAGRCVLCLHEAAELVPDTHCHDPALHCAACALTLYSATLYTVHCTLYR